MVYLVKSEICGLWRNVGSRTHLPCQINGIGREKADQRLIMRGCLQLEYNMDGMATDF